MRLGTMGEYTGESAIWAKCPICKARQWINIAAGQWWCEGENNKYLHREDNIEHIQTKPLRRSEYIVEEKDCPLGRRIARKM